MTADNLAARDALRALLIRSLTATKVDAADYDALIGDIMRTLARSAPDAWRYKLTDSDGWTVTAMRPVAPIVAPLYAGPEVRT